MAQNISYILESIVRIFVGNPASDVAPDVLPADTVPILGNWGGNWREWGFTTPDGAGLSFQREYRGVPTAQSYSEVKHLRGTKNERISWTLIEMSLDNIRDALGYGTITTVAPGAGTPGNRKLRLTDDSPMLYKAVGAEGIAPPDEDNQPRRIWFPYAQATSAVEFRMRPSEESQMGVEFRRVGGSEGVVEIHDVLAAL